MSANMKWAAVLGAALVIGCATPPKPNELEAFEKIKQSPNYQAAQRRADLVGAAARQQGDIARDL